MKFRKKPVVIDAIQYTKDNIIDIFQFAGGENLRLSDGVLSIVTLEGNMIASIGDWIIMGVNGEFYPCKNDIFEKTYDPVVEKTLAECLNMKLQDM